MEPPEIFQIAVEERILVIPLNFQNNRAVRGFSYMVDLVGCGRPFHTIHGLLDDDALRSPTIGSQRSTKSLGGAGFSSPTTHDFSVGYPDCPQGLAKLV